MYLYPEDAGELARNHGSKQDEVYEWVLVTETVTPIITTELNALVVEGRGMNKAARETAEDEREYERLRKKLGKS
jgi:hypothetical protein